MHEPDGRRRNELIWRAGEQYVVQRGAELWVIDSAGAVTNHFQPRDSSLEDEIYRTTYAVEGSELRELTRVERPYGVTDLDPRVHVTGLVYTDDDETRRFIATALGDDSVVREERRLREEAAANARVAAIDGARADFGLGPDFAAAQDALVDRVYRYGDELAASLLRTLVALARARVNLAAIAAYVRACMNACFRSTAPLVVADEPVASPLAATVAGLARELDSAADGQEWVDANWNAASYRTAARFMREAARLLGA